MQYKWESLENNSYSVKEDNTEPIEGSGTRIVLHLKEDSEEYLDDFKVCRRVALLPLLGWRTLFIVVGDFFVCEREKSTRVLRDCGSGVYFLARERGGVMFDLLG